jgi:quinol monooxygenase YgiN
MSDQSEARPGASLASGIGGAGPARGLLVTMEAKDGKQDQVAGMLNNALNSVVREPGTITWYAYRLTETEFGIFDTFSDEESRQTHLSGEVAKALEQLSNELLARPPSIQRIDIITSKV